MRGIKPHSGTRHCTSQIGLTKRFVLFHWDGRSHSIHQRAFAGLSEHLGDHVRRFFFGFHYFLFDCGALNFQVFTLTPGSSHIVQPVDTNLLRCFVLCLSFYLLGNFVLKRFWGLLDEELLGFQLPLKVLLVIGG